MSLCDLHLPVWNVIEKKIEIVVEKHEAFFPPGPAQAGPGGKKKNTCDGVAIDWLWPGQLGYYLVSSYDAQALLCLVHL